MQHRRSEHQNAMHQRRMDAMDTTESYEVRYSTYEILPHKLVDAPPYSDIDLTSHGFEAERPKAQKMVRVVDNDHQKTRYGKDFAGKVNEDNVDAKANEFIEHEHKKFQLRKWYG
ncbi:hypothetical protein RHSIM_Rhsim12G0109600 [Rhododendron simsii]|uniref:Uncharacterized protein n=1 Tax=Rhododendron simsii TaxID=118357 RepID=A0A834G130_RHOSS|nr:hypothetical protein RHSIM_Rhsim12G0109600 [Rhododendron simsii]